MEEEEEEEEEEEAAADEEEEAAEEDSEEDASLRFLFAPSEEEDAPWLSCRARFMFKRSRLDTHWPLAPQGAVHQST